MGRRCIDHLGDLCLIRHIQVPGVRFSARSLDGAHGLFEAFGINVARGNFGSCLSEHISRCAAHATGSPGDKGHKALDGTRGFSEIGHGGPAFKRCESTGLVATLMSASSGTE